MKSTLALLSALLGASLGSQCGQTPVEPEFIVGGDEAKAFSWPWQVAMFQHILFFNTFECGASVIGPNHLLTAGHCVYGSTNSPKGFLFRAGVFNKGSTSVAMEEKLMAKAIHLHPDYNHQSHENDVAVIELATPIQFNEHVQPVCLACNESLPAGTLVTVTGWGAKYSGALTLPRYLRQVQVPIISDAECAKDYGQAFEASSMLCAGVKGEDSCQGDSGGPLVYKAGPGGPWVQHGVVSWGDGCARAGKPGIYSRVAALIPFIQSVSGIGCV